MVVKSDGSKWACSSCLKGHRVSGCNHTDRELTLVPKKGRPVTQCHHCRLERKKRSAHVKCDCGETDKVHHPKEKCIHLREAEERAKNGFHEAPALDKDPAHLAAVAEEQGCCCHHGGKCTCSQTKKELVEDGAPHGPAVHKPRLESIKSDGSITVFANGHHKPVHRKNNAAHESGMPYKMHLSRSHTDHTLPTAARRSVDSLTMNTNVGMFSSQHNLPLNNDRSVKSEQQSPRVSPHGSCSGGLAHDRLSLVDFSALGPTQTNESVESVDSIVFPPFDPMSGIDCAYDPWSTFPSSESLTFPNNNPFGVWASSIDNGPLAQPALTAGSSGTQSDIDEVPAMDEMYNFHMPSIAEDAGFENAMSDNTNVNRRSLPPNFFGNTDFTNVNGWQTAGTIEQNVTDLQKPRAAINARSPNVTDSWPTPTMTQGSLRNAGNSVLPGRPQSHSIGPGSAPNDDIIRQLFPDIDVASPFGGSASPGDLGFGAAKRFGMSVNGTTSTQSEFTTEQNDGFTSQPWTDGSISVPNDAFTGAFNLDQDFASPDFSGNWQQSQ